MAGAKPGVHVLNLKTNQVPVALTSGEKVIKWDEELSTSTPCTLKVDEKAFYLYWVSNVSNSSSPQYIDISLIRDTRTGKYAKSPKLLQESGPPPTTSNQQLSAPSSQTEGGQHSIASGLGVATVNIRPYKESKMKDGQGLGGDNLDDKTLTICTGTDFVNLSWTTFVFDSASKATLWTDELLKYSRNPMAANGSAMFSLEKIYTKMKLTIRDNSNQIPVKGLIQQLATHKDERQRLLKGLEKAQLPHNIKQSIDPDDFTFQSFLTFYLDLCERHELMEIFKNMGCSSDDTNDLYLTKAQLVEFLNGYQRDPRLNEILYPFLTVSDAQTLIETYEPAAENKEKGVLSFDGLLLYLLSDENLSVSLERYDMSDDMSQPMSHYFINSSHNTYLTGHQMKSQSSVEIYRQVLLSGCRCIELDCWPGDKTTNEPMITHGYTVCTEVPFKDVIEAIAESAFKTSDFPVILSFENHVTSSVQQKKMATYCRDIFGDLLLSEPLPNYPLESGHPMPSPELLKRKILIKNSKSRTKQAHEPNRKKHSTASTTSSFISDTSSILEDLNNKPYNRYKDDDSDSTRGGGNRRKGSVPNGDSIDISTLNSSTDNGSSGAPQKKQPPSSLSVSDSDTGSLVNGDLDTHTDDSAEDMHTADTLKSTKKLSSHDANSELSNEETRNGASTENNNTTTKQASEDLDSGESDSDDEDLTELEKERLRKDAGTAYKEVTSSEEMSCLVNYCTPVSFHSFEYSKKKSRSYEMSSFVETVAVSRMKKDPIEFVNYNKRQMSRIYPKGTRVDSSNYMPQVFWNSGCQFVALNFQTLDLPMQLNQGIFELNHSSGYLLKPDFMRREQKKFDLFAESTVDGIVAGTVSIRILSGYFLTDKLIGTYVEVDMYGLPADTVRGKFRTKTVPNNGINPRYDEEEFLFKKVVLPNLATLRVAVYDERGKLIGHRLLPVSGLCPGYRHISLRNEVGQALMMPTLFVYLTVKDYVPDAMADFANALSNPIAYQSNLEKHTHQLMVLTDDFDVKEEENGLADVAEKDEDEIDNTPASTLQKAQSEEHLDGGELSTTSPKPVTLSPMSHATSMPQLDANMIGSTQNISTLSATIAPAVTYVVPSHPQVGPRLSVVSTASIPAMSMPALVTTGADDSSLTAQQTEDIQLRFSGDDVVGAPAMEQVQRHKLYKKILSKQQSDLKKLDKKHKKALLQQHCSYDPRRNKLRSLRKVSLHSKSKQCAVERIAREQAREVKKFEARQRRSLRTAAKNGTFKQMKHATTTELKHMKLRHDHELKESQKSHVDLHLEVYKEYYTEQLNIKLRYIQPLHDSSVKAIERVHEDMKKRLQKLHDKQKSQVLSLMHSKRKSKLKELQQKHKNKGEMARLKREFESKHVKVSVNLCEWLSETIVPVSKQAIDENIRVILEKLQHGLVEDQEKYKEHCVDQITQREKELVKAFSALSPTDEVIKDSAETNGTLCTTNNSSTSQGESPPAKFEPIKEEDQEDENTHL